MNQSTYHALYSDGATYAVVYDAKERQTYLATTDGGFMSVPYYLGTAEFVRYGYEYVPPKGLRGCDWWTNVSLLNAQLALLTPPAKPAAPTPIPESREDLRVHVGTGDSFRVLQEAGAKATTQFRDTRQRARQQALQELNQPHTARARAERRLNEEHARQMRPRGGGQFIVKTSGE